MLAWVYITVLVEKKKKIYIYICVDNNGKGRRETCMRIAAVRGGCGLVTSRSLHHTVTYQRQEGAIVYL